MYFFLIIHVSLKWYMKSAKGDKSERTMQTSMCHVSVQTLDFGHCSSVFLKHNAALSSMLSFVRAISPSQGSYLHTEQHKHWINAHKTSMTRVGFEPTMPVFERAKTVHALDRMATAIWASLHSMTHKNCMELLFMLTGRSMNKHCALRHKLRFFSSNRLRDPIHNGLLKIWLDQRGSIKRPAVRTYQSRSLVFGCKYRQI
jgi:hypothetical protein